MYTGKAERNDDGSYTSSHGHNLVKGPDGQLYSGGAPIGLSVGATGGIVPTAWTNEGATPAFGSPPRAPGNPQAPVVWGMSTPQHLPSLLSLPVYLWMGMLALLAACFVSASNMFPNGLRWHSGFGIAAIFTVILSYRYLMTWFPTALVVAVASSSVWALQVWLFRHASEARVLVPPTPPETLDSAATMMNGILQSAIKAPDPWVLVTIVAGLTFHFIYWRHRRRVVRQFGWPFSRGLASAAKRLAVIGVTCLVLGQLFLWLGPIRNA